MVRAGPIPVRPASRAPTLDQHAKQLFALKDSEVTPQARRDWRTLLNVFLSFRPAAGTAERSGSGGPFPSHAPARHRIG
jgi:hypothetical protein